MNKSSQRGFVLVVVLIVVLVVVGISAVAIRQSLNDVRLSFVTGKINALFVAADTPLSMLKNSQVLTDNGMIAKLINHHKSTATDDEPTIMYLCYSDSLGAANFTADRLGSDFNQFDCQDGQVRLWFVLSALVSQAGESDFSAVPSGVTLEEVQTFAQELTNYQLKVYALAVASTIGGDCVRTPIRAKACLGDDGVGYQMLVQEFYYGYD